ncbi:MAG: TonB-dependent receptor [Hyphomonadaceae bacterium]|nr:TonB-dependent receptor [Hyphomonadaceae bacterium]
MRVVLLAATVLAATAAAAHAQRAPPPSPQAPDRSATPPASATSEADVDEEDPIVVLAPGDQIRIDRRTYTLRDDPAAQSTNMFDVLGRIPSVSVAPSGAVTLLGASNVTIQINGQPVPGANLEQVLRGLPGSDVERIEVITNPSAQYSAQASGGIINIITRNRFESGFSGTLQASADDVGGYHLGVAPSWSRGPWALSGQVGVHSGSRDSELTREREDLPAGPLTTELGQRNFAFDGWYASRMQVAYRPDERRRLSVSLDGGAFNVDQEQASELANSGGPIATRNSVTASSNENRQLTFDVQQNGDAPRELIRFNAAFSRFENSSETAFSTAPAGGGPLSQYATLSEQNTAGINIKLDIEQPRPGERFLTFGAAFEQSDQAIANALDLIAGASPPAFDAELDGIAQTLAGYVTYQFETGDWTWQPGVRAEHYRREVVSGGLETDTEDPRLFPSIHIRRAVTENIDIDLSYTSRIQRPGFQQLDPALRFVDVNRATAGNPALDPTTTDAYEANFAYQRRGRSFSVTLFDRVSENTVSQFTEVTAGGIILTTPVNAGTSEQRGLQALLRGPLSDRWRYSLSANALSREFDFLSGGVIERRTEFEYDGVAQLDYRDPRQDAVGANQLQFELRFQGPRHGLQSITDEFVMANFTWRRRLAPRLQGVLMIHDLLDSTDQVTETTTDDYFERTEFRGAGTRIRLALTYQFGAGPQRPPQEQSPSGPPIPMQ